MLCDFVPPEHSHFAPETLSFLAEAVSCFARNPVFMPETLSYYSRTHVLLGQNHCPFMAEPLFYYAKITVLLCQNHCPIMPKSLSYNARTPVLLCQNPCPYQAKNPVLLGKNPCPIGKNPCPFRPETVSVYPQAPEVPKKNYLFFQETLFYFAKDRVQKPYYFPPAQNLTFCLRNPVFCSQTIFLSPFSVRNQSSLSEPCWYFSLLAVGCKPTRARRRGKRA